MFPDGNACSTVTTILSPRLAYLRFHPNTRDTRTSPCCCRLPHIWILCCIIVSSVIKRLNYSGWRITFTCSESNRSLDYFAFSKISVMRQHLFRFNGRCLQWSSLNHQYLSFFSSLRHDLVVILMNFPYFACFTLRSTAYYNTLVHFIAPPQQRQFALSMKATLVVVFPWSKLQVMILFFQQSRAFCQLRV